MILTFFLKVFIQILISLNKIYKIVNHFLHSLNIRKLSFGCIMYHKKRAKLETKDDKGNGTKVVPIHALIKKVVRKRSSYIKANAKYAVDFFNNLKF